MNAPAASGRGIKTVIVDCCGVTVGTFDLDFLRILISYLHFHVFQLYWQKISVCPEFSALQLFFDLWALGEYLTGGETFYHGDYFCDGV